MMSEKNKYLNNLEVDELKEFIGFYDKEEQLEILEYVEEKKANIIKDLLKYSNDLAPSIMTTEYLSININTTEDGGVLRCRRPLDGLPSTQATCSV